MTILKRSEFGEEAERAVLARSVNGERAVFAEPWEAEAFALAVELSEQGHFTWTEWAATLAAELKAATDRGETDDGSHYYHYWLAALEKLVTEKGLTNQQAMQKCKEAWADAYRHTPHGKPVELHVNREPLSWIVGRHVGAR